MFESIYHGKSGDCYDEPGCLVCFVRETLKLVRYAGKIRSENAQRRTIRVEDG